MTDKPTTKHYVTASGNEVTDSAKEKQKVTHYQQANLNKSNNK